MIHFFDHEPIAGIYKIDFYLLEEISNFPIQLTDENSHQLVFINNELNAITQVDEDSLVDDTKVKTSNNGEIHEISLKYQIIVRSQSLEKLLDYYKNKPGIAIVHYYNGTSKIYGNNEEPLFLQYQNKAGSQITDKAFTIVEITGMSRNRAVYYKP